MTRSPSDADHAKELLDLAVEVATEAGRSGGCRSAGAVVEVAATKSSPTDVVTAVDVASEPLIRRADPARSTRRRVPRRGGWTTRLGTSGVTWVADPIDGTVNFLYGIPQFAVSHRGRVDGRGRRGAVVHNPVSGETFTAAPGGGAFLDGQPIWRLAPCPMDHACVWRPASLPCRCALSPGAAVAAAAARWCATSAGSGPRRSICASSPAVGSMPTSSAVSSPGISAAGSLIAQEAGARVESPRCTEPRGSPRGRRPRRAVRRPSSRLCSRPRRGWPIGLVVPADGDSRRRHRSGGVSLAATGILPRFRAQSRTSGWAHSASSLRPKSPRP